MNKKITAATLLSLVMTSGAMAQSFSDDFEGFSAGDYIGTNSAEWTTWSGTTGGTEDAQVVTNNSNSGSNAIYFSSTVATGGPQDVVLPFGGTHNTGTFEFETYLNVESGKGAYFNFQGTATLGGEYTIDCQLDENGNLTLTSGGITRAATSFTHDSWFKLTIQTDLNTNSWEALIDDVSFGTFTNATYQVTSLDLFPVNASNNQSGFWVDDISYDHTVYIPTALNASLTNINFGGNIAGSQSTPTVEVRNLGTTAIASFDIEIDYNGSIINKSISGENIAQNGTLTITMDDQVTLVAGSTPMVATISNVNGGTDDNAADDVKTINIDPIIPAVGKIVVGEEATGTWCGFCPRGAVALAHMEENYHDHFIGIAVHNGANDPMVYGPYDTGLGVMINGYPSGVVDRQAEMDPGDFEAHFLTSIVNPTVLTLEAGAQYNVTNDSLYISISSEFIDNASGNYKMAVVITEDSITGTTSGYAQSNYYAANAYGPMGGYENLPSTVPANQMVYDHVGRIISPSFAGSPNVFPASVTTGETFVHTFHLAIDPEWDLSKISIVGMVMAPDGKVENATKAILTDAIATGYTEGDNVVGLTKLEAPETNMALYPNPTNGNTTLSISTISKEMMRVSIVDINGRVIYTNKVAANNGTTQIELNTTGFAKGVYNVQLEQGQSLAVRKLIVE